MAVAAAENGQTGALETADDAGPGGEGLVKRWMLELALAAKIEAGWRKNAEDACKRFRDEAAEPKGAQAGRALGTRFNILRSNVETLAPALYNATPKPDVRRRFRDPDPLGKVVAQALERAISFQIDTGDFDGALRLAVKDALLPGRAVTRLRYEPTLVAQKGDDGEPAGETKAWESVCCEHVQWRDFRRGPGRTWDEVTWIAFRHFLRREEAVEQFGDLAKSIALDATPDHIDDEPKKEGDGGPDPDVFKRLLVWEVWNKDERRVLFIAPSFKDKPLKVEDDPLGLDGFFPIPRPLYACEQTETLVPVEDYRAYRDQARELDRITARITKLIEACKARGAYDSTIPEIAEVMKGDDNALIPAENVTALIERGGLDKAIWMLPIEQIAKVLAELYAQRDQIKQTIYEITGISDILRGATDARETAAAQNIKSQWGTLRVQQRQREVQRYARDLVRMMAEIIGEHFSPATLQQMTGLTLDGGAWAQVMQVIRSDAMRSYRVDIETDSTVAGDVQAAQQNASEFVQGVTGLFAALGPAVQAGAVPMAFGATLLAGFSQLFKLPRTVTDAIEDLAAQPPQPPQQQGPDPAAQQAAADAAAKQRRRDGARARDGAHRQRCEGSRGPAPARPRKGHADAAQGEGAGPEGPRPRVRELETHGKLQLDVARINDGVAARGEEREAAAAERQPEQDAAGAVQQMADRVEEILGGVLSKAEEVGSAIAELAEEARSPREIVRGPDGKATGVKVGGKVRQIARGDDGRVSGLT
jgi:hypothetical protein